MDEINNMEQETIELPDYDSFKYASVWLITEYKDGCIYGTEFIGNAKIEDVSTDRIFSNIKHITISSMSPTDTKMIKKHPNNKYVPENVLWNYYQFEPLTREEIIKIVDEYYKDK